jgi:hypothetical protein
MGAEGVSLMRPPVFTPTTESRRLTRSLSHETHTTADGRCTNFSNSAPQAKHAYS